MNKVVDMAGREFEFAKQDLVKVRSALKSAMFRRLASIADRVVSYDPNKDKVHCCISGQAVLVFIHLNSLSGLKDPRLENVLNMLDSEEYRSVGAHDFPSMLTREYRFEYEAGDGSVVVVVSASFQEDSPTCKRVIVGYRTPQEPQPIYELRCEDEDR